ncbi:hypothetical protein JYU34_006240 [Plutella xylostella]|uniref:Uncharacterized protein n=1 Tax=Plutella xylostella TaxID=51655 RepID=A0ABQ7QV98_PLUXY|nr:hypothetical protein JYU34_006240 [Plutella xylostella]
MPKRKRNESKEERWERKRKRYERRLEEQRKRNSQRIIYSSEEDDVQFEDHLLDEVDGIEAIPNDSENEVEAPQPPPSSPSAPPPGPTSVDVTNSESMDPVPEVDPEIDTELLEALGVFEDEPLEWGEDIQEAIAKRFERVLLQGLKKDEKADLLKKYLFPKNCPSTKPPMLNPELTNMLQENAKTRDKRLLEKQSQIGKALSALGSAMTSLLKKNMDKADVVRNLNDAAKILADSHFAETETRRALILPLIDKPLIESFKERRRDSFLFGDKLCELVKNSRGIMRTGQIIQGPTAGTSGTNLNSRGPPPRYRQQYRTGPFQPSRGGQRTPYVQRRRPPPPPPPARRPPPPPPPPRRPPAARQPAQPPRRDDRQT